MPVPSRALTTAGATLTATGATVRAAGTTLTTTAGTTLTATGTRRTATSGTSTARTTGTRRATSRATGTCGRATRSRRTCASGANAAASVGTTRGAGSSAARWSGCCIRHEALLHVTLRQKRRLAFFVIEESQPNAARSIVSGPEMVARVLSSHHDGGDGMGQASALVKHT